MATVSDCMSAAFRLPIAKMLDIWGRAEGFAVMAVVATVGMVMMAACQDIATYAAAQVCSGVSDAAINANLVSSRLSSTLASAA